jgi:hypothetical protein
MISTHFLSLLRKGAVLVVACPAALLIAGCGGGSSSTTAAQGSNSPLGAGGALAEVPIAVAPASGPCAASGTPALQSPNLNSQLDCAP